MPEADRSTPNNARASEAFRAALEVVGAADPSVVAAITSELADQRSSLKLIASENYASPAVLLAMGNWLSDKYAEGTIGRRMYAGCRNVDTVEQLAADRAGPSLGPTTPTCSRIRGSTPTWWRSGLCWRNGSKPPPWPAPLSPASTTSTTTAGNTSVTPSVTSA